MQPWKRITERGAFLLLAGIGVYLGVFGTQNLLIARASLGWPNTTMRVVETRVETNSGRRTTSHDPVVRYVYQVNGTTYEAERVTAYPNSGSRSKAEVFLRDYPTGSEHPVYYDPQQPATAVLIPGESPKNYVQLGGGVLSLALAGWGLFLRREEDADSAA